MAFVIVCLLGFFCLSAFFFSGMWSYVAQAGLKLEPVKDDFEFLILLPLPLECWGVTSAELYLLSAPYNTQSTREVLGTEPQGPVHNQAKSSISAPLCTFALVPGIIFLPISPMVLPLPSLLCISATRELP